MEDLDGFNPKTKFFLYRFSVWCGLFVVFGSNITFKVLGDIFPPPDPSWEAARVVEFFLANRTNLLWAVVTMGFVAPFFYFFSVITSIQMRRAEGGFGLLSQVQLFTAVVAPIGWCYPLSTLATAVYRPERSPDLIYLLSDQFYLTFVGVAFIFSINILSIGLAALLDKKEKPVFPRWFGWANIIFAFLFAPGILVYAFKSGPFAWNGVYALWIPTVSFVFWKIMMIWGLLRAIKSEEREELEARAALA